MAIATILLLVPTVVLMRARVTLQTADAPSPDATPRTEKSSSEAMPLGSKALPTGAASDGAIESEEEAISAAIAELSDNVHPRQAAARLMTGVDVGKWLDQCLSWQFERPHWLVALETDIEPHFFGPDEFTDMKRDFVGTYIVMDANEGAMSAFGGLSAAEYDNIVHMRHAALPIAFETPLPPISGALDESTDSEREQILAKISALPTDEAACRATHW